MFCRHHHAQPCADCQALREYVEKRVKRCTFGPAKPVCSHCKVHCFKPEMRRRIREVMQYAGPRMLYRHPLHALRHLIHKYRRP